MKRIALLASLLVACAAPTPPPPNCPAAPPPAQAPPPPVPPPATKGADIKTVIALVNANDAKGLYELFDDGMKAAVPADKLAPMTSALGQMHGKLLSWKLERGTEDDGKYRVEGERGAWEVLLTTNSAGKISGLRFTEPPAPEPAVAKSTLAMGLPFKGQWSVLWGGDNKDVNAHVGYPSQRRAADLGVVEAGQTHKGDGKKNEDYFAYGKDVFAVADGTVVQAVDGVPENVPGETAPLMAAGNNVILDHGNKVFSFYAHLQTGKVKVKAGAKVKKGTLLGFCGNTGNSSEPHLHFQLQDGPSIDHSWGIEPIFANVSVTRAGKTSVMPSYTWLKDDLVGDAPKHAAPKSEPSTSEAWKSAHPEPLNRRD